MEAENTKEKIIEENIVNTLKSMGVNYYELSKGTMRHFEKIEKEILIILENEKKARKLLNENQMTIKNISKKSGIARQTFYNNPLLKDYILERSKGINSIEAKKSNLEKDQEIEKLKKEIKLYQKRDIEFMELKSLIKTLSEQNKNYQNKIIEYESMLKNQIN